MMFLPAILVAYFDAVLNVDLAVTFMLGGGLPVPGGHEIVSKVLEVNALFSGRQRYSTYEAHELGHIYRADSFLRVSPYGEVSLADVEAWMASGEDVLQPHALFTLKDLRDYVSRFPGQRMTVWPKHSDRLERSGEMHPSLAALQHMYVLRKGHDPLRGSLGCFANDIGEETELDRIMKRNGVRRIFITGLALNFCVTAAALQAVERGYEVYVVLPATAGIEVCPGNIAAALDRMEEAGIRFVNEKLEPVDRYGQRLAA